MARAVLVAVALLALGACSGGDDATDPASAPTTATTASTAPSTRAAPSSAPVTTPTTAVTTTTGATTTTTTTLPGVAGLAADALEVREIGRSVDGRPIRAVARGTAGGVSVVVIGVIHGDEAAGVAVLDRLATLPVPAGVELWLVESMNPDGQAVPQRGNANGVDLNRNFPHDWGPIGAPGDGQYAGTGPASEPETQALVTFVEELRPALTLFYHQDLHRLSPGTGFEGELKARYAALTGLPIERITGGTYTGVAATWVRRATRHPAFIVELGATLEPASADDHAAAVLDLATLVSR